MNKNISSLFEWPLTASARIFNRRQPREGRKKTLFRLPARDLSEFVAVLLIVLGLLSTGRASAQTFTTLYSFTATQTNSLGTYTNGDGANPRAGLILSGNTLYGTAVDGGGWGNGAVFAMNTDGTGFTNLHSFTATQTNSLGFYTNSDGANPWAGLILSGNKLYGTAYGGGSAGDGTVFAVNTDGTGFTNLYSFTAIPLSLPWTNGDGAYPEAGLVLSGNTLYGTAYTGGSWGDGTVFAINTDGTGFTNLHSFTAITQTNSLGFYTNGDGVAPLAGLILSGNTLYGTAASGGSWGQGTVFAIDTAGTGFANLHNFNGGSDGRFPAAGLILSGDTLYGTANENGAGGLGTVFAVNTDGTGFTTLHSFNYSDGAYLYAGLVLSGNTLYGTASEGGSGGVGTVFAVNTDGTGFTNLYGFTGGSDGGYPNAGLTLSGNTLYGTAGDGGSSGNGTVFRITLPGPAQTLTVTNTADIGPGTLREALAGAGNGDTIDATGVSGTILLTSGELLVTNSVTILGPGPANLAVDGNAASRVFHISGAVVTIAGLSITNGRVSGNFPTNSGGGIFSGPGTLTVSNCNLSGNSAAFGGGIFNNGGHGGSATLTLSACTLSGNSAASSAGGGIYNYGYSGSATLTVSDSTLSGNLAATSGGGIFNSGWSGSATLTLSGCTLSGSSAANGYGGGIFNSGQFSGTGTVQIVSSTLSGNLARVSGGGIYSDGYKGSATLTVSNSTLSGNLATAQGGGIYNDGSSGSAMLTLSGCTLRDNSASTTNVATASGGGIYNDGGGGSAMLTLIACTLSGNSANPTNVASGPGGGIYNNGAYGSATLTLSNSTLNGNSGSGPGGGIYNEGYAGTGTVQIAASTLSGNSAGTSGGGIYNDGYTGSATLTVSASTLSSNSAANVGGGIYNTGASSGTGTVQLANSTLSGNLANIGGAIYNDGGGGSASVELGSTILKAGAVGANIANVLGTVSSDGYNLASDDGGDFLTGTADQINTDPLLGPLQDNGGPTFTHALLPGSPAIDQGYSFGLTTDQRGFPRTVDGRCIVNALGGDGTDIGAFEAQQPCPVAVSLGNVGVVSGQFGFDIAGGSNQVVVVEASVNLVSWTALATNTLGLSPLHFSDPGSTNFQQRFYRAKLLP